MPKMKKKYVLIFDSETTQAGRAFDVAWILLEKNYPFKEIDRQAFIIRDYCNEPLFSLNGATGQNNHFSARSLAKRTENYRVMLRDNERSLISVECLNARLAMLCSNYNPEFYAYNVEFDWNVLIKSGIRTDFFKVKKCLMQSAVQLLLPRKSFKLAALKAGNFSPKNFMQFSAEKVYSYIIGKPFAEKHTALEDCEIEVEIYKYLARQKKAVDITRSTDWKAISLPVVYASLHE